MKGIIFRKFVDMVDEVFGPEVSEKIIEEADLPSGGVYTNIGSYKHTEILSLVTKLSEHTEMEVSDLVRAFGKFLFGELIRTHPKYVEEIGDTFQMLHNVNDHIHVEVRKLYPNAELPEIICQQKDNKTLILDYRSERPFAAVAEGLITGCIDYFKQDIAINCMHCSNDGCNATFELKKAA